MDAEREQQLLDQLRGLQLPPEPGIWPPAPGWWLAAAAVLVALATAWLIRRWRRQTWRKVALREHRRIVAAPRDSASQRARALAQLSVLMRRVALASRGRAAAAVTDEDWLATLDALSNCADYTNGVGKLLQRHPYMPPDSLSATSIDELLQLSAHTIRTADLSDGDYRRDRLEGTGVRV